MKHLLSLLLTLLSLTTGGLTTTATQAHATHCPGCDTSESTYGSSAWERRYDSGKYQEGNGQYPRASDEASSREREDSNVQRYNRERDRQDNRQDQRRENSQDNSRGYSGGDTCKSLYGC